MIDDLIILGRGCPERIRNGRTTVCTAGYSHTYGFMRIFPTKIGMPLKRWSIVEVPVERNPKDTRAESWKIEGAKSEWDRLEKKVRIVGELGIKDRLDTITSLADDCVETVSQAKRSLGVVRPVVEKCYFSEQEDYDVSTQLTLLGLPLPKTKEQYPITPRIKYRCSGCKAKNAHDQQVLEWGFYEWIRKHPENPSQVWENARIHSSEHELFFFIGNLLRHRNRFVIISALVLKKKPVHQSLFEPTV
jgi:hypothetical protein